VSFHSSLVSAAGWPADLVTAGIVSSTAQVISGRKVNDKARRDLTVFLERDPTVPGGAGGTGAQFVRGHVYIVHVVFPLNLGHDKTGKTQLDTVEAKLEAIAERYHGGSFPTAIFTAVPALARIYSISAGEETIDETPEDAAVLTGSVRVTFWERE
jgi:hypothetical protein